MSGYEHSSAGSHYIYDPMEDFCYETFDDTFPIYEYPQNQLNSPIDYEQSPVESLEHNPRQWPTTNALYQRSGSSQHLSGSSFSSVPSSYRSSNNSTFSYTPLRDSMSSSISAYSHTSDMSRLQHFSMAEHLLCHGPTQVIPQAASAPGQPCPQPAKGKESKRPAVLERDYFKTCVSATKQSRVCSKKHKYFCTSCERLFVEKADWKRHEETYQERPEMFKCDLCPAIYFLEKDFTKHHKESHRCTSCADTTTRSKKAHAISAKKKRMTRTGWGCGFCCHFSTEWTERCDHVARHMEKQGLTAADWYHSKVIYSLLQRPALYHAWMHILRSRPGITNCAWNQHSTGRVEGYPERNRVPQLQDYLEFFTEEQDAQALVRLAYGKMVRGSASSSSSSSLPPPVPPKDYRDTSLRGWGGEVDAWAQMSASVVEDEVLPTGMCRLEGWYGS